VHGAGILGRVRRWLPSLLVVLGLACDRPPPSTEAHTEAHTEALQAATAELAAARAAFEADRGAVQQELAALRKAVEATETKLAAVALERRIPADPDELALSGTAEELVEPRIDEDLAALAAAVRCESESRCTVERSFLETLAINPGGLVKQARIVPKFTDGRMEGIKLYGIRRTSIFRALGIKNGDLVRSVNGHAIDSTESMLELYGKLRRAKTFTVAMERKGGPFTLTVDVVGDP
jgi:general secretion pathway protein C